MKRDEKIQAWEEAQVTSKAPSEGEIDVASGRHELRQRLLQNTSTSPLLAGGDIDARWEDAEASGDEAAGGSTPTPDQNVVDDCGAALGLTYKDDEELRFGDKERARDEHRWELDPASAEDYLERTIEGRPRTAAWRGSKGDAGSRPEEQKPAGDDQSKS